MVLPCPHCKKRFKLSPDRLPAGAAKLKCPACKGVFVVDTSPLRSVEAPNREPATPGPPVECGPQDPPTPAVSEAEAPGERKSRRERRPSAMWLLLPASGLLVALLGILAPTVWEEPATSATQTAKGESTAVSVSSPPPFSEQAEEVTKKAATSLQHAKEQGVQSDRTRPPYTYRSMWPFSPLGKQKSCEYLEKNKDEWRGKKAGDRSDFYAPWIAYLSLESSSTPACDLEAVFRSATEAIGKGELCGRGYAFLSAYYSYKRVLDRSRSFLEEALQLSPEDPWVRLMEGVVYKRDLRDLEEAARTLDDLLREEPSFSLAQYHLAKIYVEEEEYSKAKGLFLLLEKAFPGQRGFMRIRQSLEGIESVPYYSVERAKGLLKVSRALTDLMDYPLAGRLCREVLEDTPGTLPKAEKTSAFYDLGRISEITGDKETAFSCYQKALRIDPFYRDARERIGFILKGEAQAS